MLADNAVMTDIPLNSNFQLKQALTELVKAGPNSPVARQAIEVVVRQLEGNQISLSPALSAQIKTALIPNTNLKGTLNSGQTYQAKLSQESANLLQFFSKTAPAEQTKLPVSEQLSQALLKLPANQLSQVFALNKLSLLSELNPKTANLFAVLQATIVDISGSEQSNKQWIIKLDTAKASPLLTIPVSQNNSMQKGDGLIIELLVKGKNWQVNVSAVDNSPALQGRTLDQLILSGQAKQDMANVKSSQTDLTMPRGETALKNQALLQSTHNPTASIKMTLAPEVASDIIKTLLQQQANKQSIDINLPLKTFITQLSQNNTPSNNALLNQVLNLLPEKISLKLASSGEQSLQIQHPKLMANLALSPSQLESLIPLKLISLSQVRTHTLTDAELPNGKQNTQGQVEQSALKSREASNTNQHGSTETNVVPKIINEALATEGKIVSPKNLLSALLTLASKFSSTAVDTSAAVATPLAKNTGVINESSSTSPPLVKGYPASLPDFKPVSSSADIKANLSTVITADLLNNKPAQLTLLQNLLRLSQPKAELPSTVLANIEKVLNLPVSSKALTEPAAQTWVKQIVQELQQAVPQGNDQDASRIKQLISAPPLALTAVQLVSPPASQGLLSGLVTLLQVSLASRLMRSQPSQAERLAQILPSIFSESSKGETTTSPVKAMLEFGQLEQRGQVMREISRLLADHQSSKLVNAEKLLQGQETFYYNLPSLFGDKFNNIELLIKREEHNKQEAQQDANATKSWQLTMKLSVGELGELLTKAKLRPDHVEIDFYASNEPVKHQVMNFMPLLKKRLASLGIEITKSQCQLGKIPQTLDERPYHIFMAKA